MVQRLISCLSVLCLFVTTTCGSDRPSDTAPPAPPLASQVTPVVETPHVLKVGDAASPIDHIRQAADHLDAAAIGDLTGQMRATARELRETADQVEQDITERLADLRNQQALIQSEIERLSGKYQSPHQIQLDIQVVQLDRAQLRRYGIDLQVIFENGDHNLLLVGGESPSAIKFAVADGREFQVLIDALRSNNSAKVIAEPSVVTTSGHEASINFNGEASQSGPAYGEVEHDFAISATAVPDLLGNGRLKLAFSYELSERDYANAVLVEGHKVPGITTRRVNTDVEMKVGSTLMIGGLVSQESPSDPAMARSTEKELVVLVTPSVVAPLSN